MTQVNDDSQALQSLDGFAVLKVGSSHVKARPHEDFGKCAHPNSTNANEMEVSQVGIEAHSHDLSSTI
jgi:hypothetical protein